MTLLNCAVTNCHYNEEACCRRDNINVEGASANSSTETCCGSFAEKTANSVTNRVGEAKKETEVSCKAENCNYNQDCRCTASNIGVAGEKACCCGETECSTFSCK